MIKENMFIDGSEEEPPAVEGDGDDDSGEWESVPQVEETNQQITADEEAMESWNN